MQSINKLDDIKDFAIRKQPVVFISKLVIYKSISPLEIIREIKFSLGVNIISTLHYDSRNENVDIIGHSVGKTTLCRFIRHILGEPTYSNEVSSRLISKKFPDGWIGAEITVHNISYAVLRHIGTGNFQSRIAQSISLESLISESNKGPSKFNVSQESYISKLGLNIPYSFENPRCLESTNWLQVLAWCSRDQESRYKSLHNWRDSESSSKTPVFSSTKEGPLYVIRYLLGLINDEETTLEHENLTLQRNIEYKRVNLNKLDKIPQIQISLLEKDLKEFISRIIPNCDISTKKILNTLGELPRFGDSIENDIQEGGELNNVYKQQLNDFSKRKYDIKERQDALIEELRKLRNKQESYRLLLLINNGKKEHSKSSDDKFLEEYDVRKKDKCTLGGCTIENCSYVIDKKFDVDSRILKDQSFEEYRSGLNETSKRISKEINALSSSIENIKKEKNSLETEYQEISAKEIELKLIWTSIVETVSKLRKYSKEIINPTENLEFIQLQDEIEHLNETLENNKNRLKKLILKHDENKKILENIFNFLIRNILTGSSCNGIVSFKERNINFAIKRNNFLFGQAMEVLSVLLADISSLVYSIINENSIHPLFLIHDSPKEADLDDRIYRSFISFMVKLSNAFEIPPFQYIITTTTPPPPDTDSKLILSTDEMLLKVNIFEELNEPELQFDE